MFAGSWFLINSKKSSADRQDANRVIKKIIFGIIKGILYIIGIIAVLSYIL